MKLQLIAIITVFLFTECNDTNTSDIKKTTLYSNGIVKNVLSLTRSGIKNGECIYYDKYGTKDSSVIYSNGIKNGLKKVYSSYGRYENFYKNGVLINHKEYNSLNVLKYETPLNIKSLSKTTYKLLSNRNYLDKHKTDTIVIINKTLPTYNRAIGIIGPLSRPLGDDSFIIGKTDHFHDFKFLKIYIRVHQNTGDSTEIPTPLDTLNIKVK